MGADSVTTTRRFGVFELDLRSGDLRKSGVRIRVQEQPLKVLEALLERPGEIVTREELRARVWPHETFGNFDHAVNIAVAKLRAALGDSAETPRFIETLHGRGYRLIAPADSAVGSVRVSQHRPILLATLVLTGILVASGFGAYFFFMRTGPLPFQNFTITQITNTGKAELAAISPDGKYIVHVQNDRGMRSLWLRNVSTGSNTQIIQRSPAVYRYLAFSSDGDYVYFQIASDGLGVAFDLYRAPVLGGTSQLVLRAVDTNISFSPDGRRMAYLRANSPELGKYWLLTADADGSNETTLQMAPIENNGLPISVSWSRDGNRIVYDVLPLGYGTSAINIFNGTRKKPQLLARFKDKSFFDMQWMPDGHSLLAMFADNRGSNIFRSQIGAISYPEGKLTPITRDTNAYATLTASADGKSVATVQVTTTNRIDLASRQRSLKYASLGFPQQEDNLTAFDWFPDGFVITDGVRLARVGAKGDETTLIADPNAAILQVTACGDRYAVLAWAAHGTTSDTHLWRINSDGSGAKQLTSRKGESEPACSPDGKWVYYFGHSGLLERVPIEGGKPEAVSGSRFPNDLAAASSPVFSRDGKELFFVAALIEPYSIVALTKVAALNLQPGTQPSPRLLDVNPAIIARCSNRVSLRLTPDGRGLAYPITGNGVDNVWVQPLDGSTGYQVTNFTSGQIADFRWSPTGKDLAVLHQENKADVVLLRQGAD